MAEGMHSVVYRAIADFRDLYAEIAKAKAALKTLDHDVRGSRGINVGTSAGLPSSIGGSDAAVRQLAAETAAVRANTEAYQRRLDVLRDMSAAYANFARSGGTSFTSGGGGGGGSGLASAAAFGAAARPTSPAGRALDDVIGVRSGPDRRVDQLRDAIDSLTRQMLVYNTQPRNEQLRSDQIDLFARQLREAQPGAVHDVFARDEQGRPRYDAVAEEHQRQQRENEARRQQRLNEGLQRLVDKEAATKAAQRATDAAAKRGPLGSRLEGLSDTDREATIAQLVAARVRAAGQGLSPTDAYQSMLRGIDTRRAFNELSDEEVNRGPFKRKASDRQLALEDLRAAAAAEDRDRQASAFGAIRDRQQAEAALHDAQSKLRETTRGLADAEEEAAKASRARARADTEFRRTYRVATGGAKDYVEGEPFPRSPLSMEEARAYARGEDLGGRVPSERDVSQHERITAAVDARESARTAAEWQRAAHEALEAARALHRAAEAEEEAAHAQVGVARMHESERNPQGRFGGYEADQVPAARERQAAAQRAYDEQLASITKDLRIEVLRAQQADFEERYRRERGSRPVSAPRSELERVLLGQAQEVRQQRQALEDANPAYTELRRLEDELLRARHGARTAELDVRNARGVSPGALTSEQGSLLSRSALDPQLAQQAREAEARFHAAHGDFEAAQDALTRTTARPGSRRKDTLRDRAQAAAQDMDDAWDEFQKALDRLNRAHPTGTGPVAHLSDAERELDTASHALAEARRAEASAEIRRLDTRQRAADAADLLAEQRRTVEARRGDLDRERAARVAAGGTTPSTAESAARAQLHTAEQDLRTFEASERAARSAEDAAHANLEAARAARAAAEANRDAAALSRARSADAASPAAAQVSPEQATQEEIDRRNRQQASRDAFAAQPEQEQQRQIQQERDQRHGLGDESLFAGLEPGELAKLRQEAGQTAEQLNKYDEQRAEHIRQRIELNAAEGKSVEHLKEETERLSAAEEERRSKSGHFRDQVRGQGAVFDRLGGADLRDHDEKIVREREAAADRAEETAKRVAERARQRAEQEARSAARTAGRDSVDVLRQRRIDADRVTSRFAEDRRTHPLLSIGAAVGSPLRRFFDLGSEERRVQDGLARIVNLFRSADRKIGAGGGGGNTFGANIYRGFSDWADKIVNRFGGLGRTLFSWRGLIILAIAALGPLVAALGALGGAALGVGQSLVALAGNLALLPNLFSAAALGVAALYAALSPVAKVFSAYNAAQNAATTASASRAKTLRDEKRAEESLSDARRQAKRDLEDLHTQLSRAKLDEQGAVLSVEEAKDAYRRVLADPNATLLDRQRAYYNILQAQNDLADVQTKNKRLAEDTADADKRGIENNRQVLAAKDALIESQKQVIAGTSAAYKADQQYQAALEQLGPKTRKVVEAILGQAGAFRQLKKDVGDRIFGPIADRQLHELGPLFDIIKKSLLGAGTSIGKTLSDALQLLFARRGDLQSLADSNARILGSFGQGAVKLLDAVLDIMVVAAPYAEKFADSVARVAGEFSGFIKKAKADGTLAKFFDIVEERSEQAEQIVKNILQTVGRLFFATDDFAKGQGDSLVEITGKWADWAKKAEEPGSKFRKWLQDIKPLLSEIGGFIGEFAKAFATMAADPRNIAEAKKIFDALARLMPTVASIFSQLAASGWVSDILNALDKLAGALEQFLDKGGELPIQIFVKAFIAIAEVWLQIAALPGVPQVLIALGTAAAFLSSVALVAKFTGLFAVVRFLGAIITLWKAGGGGLIGFLRGVGAELIGISRVSEATNKSTKTGKQSFSQQGNLVQGAEQEAAAAAGGKSGPAGASRIISTYTTQLDTIIGLLRLIAQEMGVADEALEKIALTQGVGGLPGGGAGAAGAAAGAAEGEAAAAGAAAGAAAKRGLGSRALSGLGKLLGLALDVTGLSNPLVGSAVAAYGAYSAGKDAYKTGDPLGALKPKFGGFGETAATIGKLSTPFGFAAAFGAADLKFFQDGTIKRLLTKGPDKGSWIDRLLFGDHTTSGSATRLNRSTPRGDFQPLGPDGKPLADSFTTVNKQKSAAFFSSWSGAWDTVRGMVQSGFRTISRLAQSTVVAPFQAGWSVFSGTVKSIFNEWVGTLRTAVAGAIQSAPGFLQGALAHGWQTLQSQVAGVFRAVASVIASVPAAVIDAAKRVPGLGKVLQFGTNVYNFVTGRQSGGLIDGTYDGRPDTRHVMLTVGEWVTRKRVVDKPYAKQLLADLNEERLDPAMFYRGLAVRPGGLYLPTAVPASATAGPVVNNSHTVHQGRVDVGGITINNPVRERSERSLRRAVHKLAHRLDR